MPAGRCPPPGLLVYFGIPSVSSSTPPTCGWPAAGPGCSPPRPDRPPGWSWPARCSSSGSPCRRSARSSFKLAFAWYLNALFNLNPFLALDGYYLLMDWLEIPNLRARGLSWVSARLRRRPPRWSALDREGRLVALYGMLAVLWVAIAVNIALPDLVRPGLRAWSPACGTAAGSARLLLAAVIVGLCAPLLYLLAGRLARWWRCQPRARRRTQPRGRPAPRGSPPCAAPTSAACPGPRWPASPGAPAGCTRRPGGSSSSPAPASRPSTSWSTGALQGRRHGDPGGTIRHHVGPGGVVGLADALTGRAATLDWHTAGTTLLTLPTATVATVIGPMPGPPPADRAEAESLFADTPALAALAGDERLALIAASHPVDLEPGAPVMLPGPTHAVIVESGVVAMPDGVELRRGTLIGPVGDGSPGMVAQARTPVRLWVMPDASELPPLVGAARHAVPAGPPT